jgi:1-phosphofructokinase
LRLLKVSDEDLIDDGALSEGDAEAAVWVAVDKLIDRGVDGIVVSRGDKPVLARFGSDRFTAETPGLEPVDDRGAGDSMTAGLAAATVEGKPPDDVLRLGCGAGAANVTRHGLASADAKLIDRVAPLVVIKEVP